MSRAFRTFDAANSRENRPGSALVAEMPRPVNALVVVLVLLVLLITGTGSGYF